MVKFVAITVPYAATYSRIYRSTSNQNSSVYENVSEFKGNNPLVVIYKIHILK